MRLPDSRVTVMTKDSSSTMADGSFAAFFLQSHQTREARRNLYAANMNLAQRDWDNANPVRIAGLLSETESYPDKGFEWYFWQRQLHLELQTFRVHAGAVIATGFSPDGARLVSGDEDGTMRVWDVATGRPLLRVKGGRGPVRSVSFSRDGRKLLTASQYGTATLWNAETGAEVLSLHDLPEMCFAAALSPDAREIITVSRVSSGRLHLTVQVWDAESGEPLRVLEAMSKGGGTSSVSYSRDGSRVAAITEGMRVKIWESATGRELAVIPSGYYYSLGLSPDGRRLVTGAGKAEVWNAETVERVLTLEGDYKLEVLSVAYSPDGRTIATGSGDQQLLSV